MPRSLSKYLADVLAAIEDSEMFTAGKVISEYESDTLLQAAVERKFIVIGEALTQMERHYPGSRVRVNQAQHIIAFRNRLVHDYGEIIPSVVFDIVRGPMLGLKLQVVTWIEELDPASITSTVTTRSEI